MILARAICRETRDDLDLAFTRMGLPTAAREYMVEKLPHQTVLLTGIGRDEGRYLRGLSEREAPPGVELFPTYTPGNVAKRPGTVLLSGRRDQFMRLVTDLAAHPELGGLLTALNALEQQDDPLPPTLVGDRTFVWGERTYVMGVLNITPDSFSDGGKFATAEAAAEAGRAMAEAGADLLDIGGESTRPGARRVSADEELGRVVPVLQALRERTQVPLSIDTTKADVAREALKLGVRVVNDVSGFTFDPNLPAVVAEAHAVCCLMHMKGEPETMQKDPSYEDVVSEIAESLSRSIDRATAAGVARDRIWVDPGIGFGKTVGHNLFVLRRLQDLKVLRAPIVLGTSRKSFLGKLTGGKAADQRLSATLASTAAPVATGVVDMVRVHDVAEVRDALTVAHAIFVGREGGTLF